MVVKLGLIERGRSEAVIKCDGQHPEQTLVLCWFGDQTRILYNMELTEK